MGIGSIYGLAYGQLDLANLWYRKALSLDLYNPWFSAILGLVFLELNDDATARTWIDRSLQQSPDQPWANGAAAMLESYRGDYVKFKQYADKVNRADHRWRFGTLLSHGRVPDIRAGNYQEVLERYRSSFPELFESPPNVNAANFRPAIDIAGIYQLLGRKDLADRLLEACLQQIEHTIRVGYYGFWVSDVQILALQGRTDEALAALRQAFDQGWRTDWRYFFNRDPIRSDPRFQSIRTDLENDMARQLEHVREMEANGELVPIPEMEAAEAQVF
jgi:tetratricopeptide (TPR) repeat protein